MKACIKCPASLACLGGIARLWDAYKYDGNDNVQYTIISTLHNNSTFSPGNAANVLVKLNAKEAAYCPLVVEYNTRHERDLQGNDLQGR